MAFNKKGRSIQVAAGALALLCLIWFFAPFRLAESEALDESDTGIPPIAIPSQNIPGRNVSSHNTTSESLPLLNSSVPVDGNESEPYLDEEQLRPLILYCYVESQKARENIDFFIKQGLHGAADFIFILNGVDDPTYLEIPRKPNIRIVTRPNLCYDLGSYGEVLRQDAIWTKYKRFIMLNASIRGPFLPYWSKACWSDLYLSKLTGKTKLVGMTGNCWPRFHVQSMIWATDLVGIELLLHPPRGGSEADIFGEERDPVALSGCYGDWDAAVHAEIGSTGMLRSQGYDVDLMMMAFHKPGANYIDDCAWIQGMVQDLLWDKGYFGFNVHPYETLFVKANRNIDPELVNHLTEWHEGQELDSWDRCKGGLGLPA